MSDQAKPKIVVLDPDPDFLDAFTLHGKTRQANIVTRHYSSKHPVALEDLLFEEQPDVLIINLDQVDQLQSANQILELKRFPLPMPPLTMGTTARDALSLKVSAYESGLDDYLIRPFSPIEVWLRVDVLLRIRQLQRSLDLATRKLSSANVELTHSNRSLEVLTMTDELTGLNNMRFMTQYLEKQFHVIARHQRALSIMMIDLDHFKSVNDQNDHLVGSDTIKKVGHIIFDATRSSDTKARYGGDEYIVAMPETDIPGAEIVGERVRSSVAALQLKGKETFQITASIGIAPYDPARHTSYRDVIRDADMALYIAKEQGRNRVVIYDHNLHGDDAKKGVYDETQSSVFTEIKKIKESLG